MKIWKEQKGKEKVILLSLLVLGHTFLPDLGHKTPEPLSFRLCDTISGSHVLSYLVEDANLIEATEYMEKHLQACTSPQH
jgi:hypothetical protein